MSERAEAVAVSPQPHARGGEPPTHHEHHAAHEHPHAAAPPAPPPVEAGIPGLTEGRIVHFVLDGGRNAGEHRPGIVVKLWQPQGGPTGCVQLQVFTDGTNDGGPYAGGVVWRTSVVYSAEPRPGTWHWPERVPT